MKSQKGITLTSLVIYISVFMVIISIGTIMSNYFYRNITQVMDSPKYVSEFNKFCMFFIKDVKNNANVSSVSATEVVFEDGTKYAYKNNEIYRNDKKIAKNIKTFEFTQRTHTTHSVQKIIINIKSTIGNSKDTIKRDIDFVLRYW